jgi:site-specific recombinase XerD
MDAERRWELYLAALSASSRQQYTVAVTDFKKWCEDSSKVPINAETIVEYITYLHNVRGLKTKTIWSLNSMIGSFYEAFKGSKPHDDLPLINKLLKQWEKVDTVKKASTFESEEIFKYFREAPDDDFHLVRKVAVILAINGLERKNEITYTTIDELKFNLDCILVTFDRLKACGERKKSQFMITDSQMRAIVSKYYNLFSEELKCSKERFFRKMIKGRITQGVIGENMIAKIGEDVARWLGYSPEDAKKYTKKLKTLINKAEKDRIQTKAQAKDP